MENTASLENIIDLPGQVINISVVADERYMDSAVQYVSGMLMSLGCWGIQPPKMGPYQVIPETSKTGRKFDLTGWRPVTDCPVKNDEGSLLLQMEGIYSFEKPRSNSPKEIQPTLLVAR